MMKKFLRTFLSILLVFACMISVTACGDKPDPDNDDGDTPEVVAELNVSAALGLDRFETRTLEATDKNGAKVNATWQIADSSIATVSGDGAVSARAVGQTKVTATYNGHTAECTVTVRDSGERPHLSVFSNQVTMVTNGQVAVIPTVTYKNAPISAEITVEGGSASLITYVVEDGVITFTAVGIGTTNVQIGATVGDYTLTPITVTIDIISGTL